MMWSYTFYFYPRPPRGGRRPTRTTTSAAIGFLSTPSARRATLLSGYGRVRDDISIHALREEGDAVSLPSATSLQNFYPRPPRGGRRKFLEIRYTKRNISIHALREEGDAEINSYLEETKLISIHALREEGDRRQQKQRRLKSISIHALREEGDML